MAAEPQAPESLAANGSADAHQANGGPDDSATKLENGAERPSAAEKKRLKKKQRKANKQAQRYAPSLNGPRCLLTTHRSRVYPQLEPCKLAQKTSRSNALDDQGACQVHGESGVLIATCHRLYYAAKL